LRLAVKLGILDEVLFVGSTTEPEKYYGAADLLAHPTFYDACSLTVIEALSSGLPVLTSSANGASGIAQSGERVRVIEDPKKVDQMCQAIRDLLVEGGSPVRSRVESFSEERNYRQMSEVFRQVARGRRG
jgi:UDP-glucose:(heptosyl)LPS alpha-1,3-glucosyltransferase